MFKFGKFDLLGPVVIIFSRYQPSCILNKNTRQMTSQLSKSDAPFKSNTQKKIFGVLSKLKFYFVCQFVPKRYFRVLQILDDVKQLNIRNFSSTTFRKTSWFGEKTAINSYILYTRNL